MGKKEGVKQAFAACRQPHRYDNAAHRPVMLQQLQKHITRNARELQAPCDDMQSLHRDWMFACQPVDWPMSMFKAELLDARTEAAQRAIMDRELMLSGMACYAAIHYAHVIPSGLTKQHITLYSFVLYTMMPYGFFERPGMDRYFGHWNRKGMKLVPLLGTEAQPLGRWASFPVYEGEDMYARDAVRYPIWSSTYRQWQDRHERGGDMLLFSEVDIVQLQRPMEFLMPLTDIPLETSIEVIVSDSRLISRGSQWGHVAIEIDGIVYSRAHDEYVKIEKPTYFYGGVVNLANGSIRTGGNLWRDNVGLVLKISQDEKTTVKHELERRVSVDNEFKRTHPHESTYSIFDNSCSSNVADALESIGILAHDPRWFPTPVTPAELAAVLEKSKRFAKKNYYPKQIGQ